MPLAGCDSDTENPDGQTGNVCKDYSTCNECIAGLQKNGKSEGEAETLCGAAVTGCWVRWDKPIVCNGKTYE